MLCPPSPLPFWLLGRAVCQSFPLRPVWQQDRQASQPQRLPTPFSKEEKNLFLPFLASTTCPSPHVILSTKPECTNPGFLICMLHSFSLFDSDTLIHAFAFLGDLNTSSYIQNERRCSNSIETGL